MKITSPYKHHATSTPAKYAIVTETECVTYEEWHFKVNKVANTFSTYSHKGTVAILLENSSVFLQIFAGACKAGWTASPLDSKWSPYDMEERLQLCKPNLIVTEKKWLPLLTNYPTDNIYLIDDNSWMSSKTSFQEFIEDTPFYLGFTSGTTGAAKAFIRSHRSWIKSFDCNTHDFQMAKDEHVLIPGPLVHSLFLYGALSTLYDGGTVYLLRKFSATNMIQLLEQYPISAIYTVPTMIEALLKENFSSPKEFTLISSGAKWQEGSKEQIANNLPQVKMYEFYGASELSFITFLDHYGNQNKPSSVGLPFHNVQVSIRDKGGEVGVGEIGKLYVKSDLIFTEYVDNPAATEDMFSSDGWATVHDLAMRDEDGYVYMIGREKNMVLYGGINIYPEEIETFLSHHPQIEEVAVMGIPDDYWGQKLVAFIKGKNLSPLALKRYCKTTLSPYKIPRKWYFVDVMPYTSSGKIAREELKNLTHH